MYCVYYFENKFLLSRQDRVAIDHTVFARVTKQADAEKILFFLLEDIEVYEVMHSELEWQDKVAAIDSILDTEFENHLEFMK